MVETISKEFEQGKLILSMNEMEKKVNPKQYASLIKDVKFSKGKWMNDEKEIKYWALTWLNFVKNPYFWLYFDVFNLISRKILKFVLSVLFSDSCRVRIHIVISWIIAGFKDILDSVRFYANSSWFYVDSSWFYADSCWFTLIHVDLSWFMLIWVDSCWFTSFHVDFT